MLDLSPCGSEKASHFGSAWGYSASIDISFIIPHRLPLTEINVIAECKSVAVRSLPFYVKLVHSLSDIKKTSRENVNNSTG